MSSIEPTYKLSTILDFLVSEYKETFAGDGEHAKQVIGKLNELEARKL